MSDADHKLAIFDPSVHQHDVAARIVVALERIAEAIRVSLWEKAKQHQLSPLQIQILMFLAWHDEALCRPSVLAAEFNLRKPTISAALRPLIDKGLLVRAALPSDGRGKVLQLTAAGRALVDTLGDFADELYAAARELKPEEQPFFLQQLLTYIDALQHRGVIGPQRMCFHCRFFRTQGEKMYCRFLEKTLSASHLQVDCPDFAARS